VKINGVKQMKCDKSSRIHRKEAFYLYDKASFVLNVKKKLIFVKSWSKLSGAQLSAMSIKYYFHA
jgi:hypothetical protein